ncbi:hypothetical protein L208DRAFT_1379403 [Tricholoma matsutake]|nr:hypothetical protein L208DRAFT_1379403 [Tricholoma matsutake 945]
MLAEVPIKFCDGCKEQAMACFGSFFWGEHVTLGATSVGYSTNWVTFFVKNSPAIHSMPQGSKNDSAKKGMGKLGQNSDVKGMKLAFLESHREEFLDAQEKSSNAAGKLYTKTAHLWLLNYGYELDFGEDNEDCNKPDEHLANEMLDWMELTEEEAAHRKDIYDRMHMSMHKMAAAKHPKKHAAINLYSDCYYKTCIKEKFDKLWASASQTLPRSARIQMCKAFIDECWKKEQVEFREELEKEMEEMYKAEMKAFQNGTAWAPWTAEEYHQCIS